MQHYLRIQLCTALLMCALSCKSDSNPAAETGDATADTDTGETAEADSEDGSTDSSSSTESETGQNPSSVDFVFTTQTGGSTSLWSGSLEPETAPLSFSVTLPTPGDRCPVRWLDSERVLVLEHVDPAVSDSTKVAVVYEFSGENVERTTISGVLLNEEQVAVAADGSQLVGTGEGIRIYDLLAQAPLASTEFPIFESATFVPGGGLLGFARSGNDDGRLYQVDPTTADAAELGGNLEEPCRRWLSATAEGTVVSACVPHGESIASYEIYAWNSAGESSLLTGADQDSDWSYAQPTWNPSGTALLALRGGAGPDEVVVIDPDTGGITVLDAALSGRQWSPTWIDDSTVLFSVDVAEGSEIRLVENIGSGSTIVVTVSSQISQLAAKGGRFDTATCL